MLNTGGAMLRVCIVLSLVKIRTIRENKNPVLSIKSNAKLTCSKNVAKDLPIFLHKKRGTTSLTGERENISLLIFKSWISNESSFNLRD